MHQTTYGATHKEKSVVLNKKQIELFFEREFEKYSKLERKNFIYGNKNIIDSSALNYLNCNDNNKEKLFFIKGMIRNQFDKCEKIYPYLGDMFINMFFKEKNIRKNYKQFKFNKELKKEFLKTIEDDTIKEICNIYFDNFSLENTVNIEKYFENNIKIVKKSDINFKIDFDEEFFTNVKTITNYKVILLDGYIQSVGEIHHVLNDSNVNNKNYIIFCYGMSGEVRQTILKNNKMKRTHVYPISFSLKEENINILHDISVLHNGANVISAQSNQTISQCFSNYSEIKEGKKISISKSSFLIKPACSKIEISNHRKFLQNRILKSNNEKNSEILQNRIKRFSTKNITIYIPDHFFRENNFIRNLDYMLRFFANCNKKMLKIYATDKKRFYYFTVESIFILNKIIKSFRSKIKWVYRSF